MTDQQPRPPLWRVMEKAYANFDDWPVYAAKIRAVRDYLINHSTLGENTMDLLAQESQRAEAGE